MRILKQTTIRQIPPPSQVGVHYILSMVFYGTYLTFLGPGVTIVPPTATAGAGTSSGSRSNAGLQFSVGFGLMFMTTIVTLLAGVLAVRF